MNLRSFLDGFCNVVGRRATAEVDSDGMLACGDIDDGWRGREERCVLREVGYTKGSRHDDEAQGLH